jgi:transposase
MPDLARPYILNLAIKVCLSRQKVYAIYQTRMKIEEGFRDMKSHRYGLSFDINLSKQKNRKSILILLTILLALTTTLIDWTVTQAKKHRRYQANSIKD